MESCVSDSYIRRLRSVARLTDNLISEILARVPYRSLCRFKCVSRSWLALFSFQGIRQTLSGFFFGASSAADFDLVSTMGRRFPLMKSPLFSFLPPYSGIDIVDSCNGLLLFVRQSGFYNVHGPRYFVCNPATGNWIDLPDLDMELTWRSRSNRELLRLGFDPAESPHFRVFWVVPVSKAVWMPQKVAGVQIYSSETRGWAAFRQSGWGNDTIMRFRRTRTAFFNGTLHLATAGSSSIVTVDIDGKTWRTIPTPRSFGFIGLSRGCFYAVEDRSNDDTYINNNGCRLSIWALEDYGGHEWILKHTAKPFAPRESAYAVHAIHPEDPLIFLTTSTAVGRGIRGALVSYDFMNNKVHTIETGRIFRHKDLYARTISLYTLLRKVVVRWTLKLENLMSLCLKETMYADPFHGYCGAISADLLSYSI